MATETPVDRLFNESNLVIRALGENEPSLTIAVSDNFRKSLLLAAASHFEYKISNYVLEYIKEQSNTAPLLVEFVKNKAISRQYHTWFDWKLSNANQFFGLFGAEFKQFMTDKIRKSDALKNSIQAFMEVGGERNKLVHQDFASYSMDKTLDEVYGKYKEALFFVDEIANHLREYNPPNT